MYPCLVVLKEDLPPPTEEESEIVRAGLLANDPLSTTIKACADFSYTENVRFIPTIEGYEPFPGVKRRLFGNNSQILFTATVVLA